MTHDAVFHHLGRIYAFATGCLWQYFFDFRRIVYQTTLRLSSFFSPISYQNLRALNFTPGPMVVEITRLLM